MDDTLFKNITLRFYHLHLVLSYSPTLNEIYIKCCCHSLTIDILDY